MSRLSVTQVAHYRTVLITLAVARAILHGAKLDCNGTDRRDMADLCRARALIHAVPLSATYATSIS